MSVVWRKIQRANKKSAKYLFTIAPQELLLVGSSKFEPESIVIVCMHRRRRVEGKQRKWEANFADPNRSLIVWPAFATDPLRIETTLYGDAVTGEYDDKDWTVIVEEISKKHKRHPVAAINLNMRLFIQNSADTTAQLKLKLRALRPDVLECLLQIVITSCLVSEHEKGTQSEVSSIAEEHALLPGLKARKVESLPDEKLVAGIISIKSDFEKSTEEEDSKITNWSDSKDGEHISKKFDALELPAPNSSTQTPSNVSLKSFAIESSPTPTERVNVNFSKSDVCSTMAVVAIDNKDKMVARVESPKGKDERSLVDKRSVAVVVDSEAEPKKILPPAVVDGESLLSWCQRITKDYSYLKITDFKKSFRSGLAFCAIIHRYRPGLIGDFSRLDFTESGRKENCRKSLAAAKTMDVQIDLDLNQMMVLSPEANEGNVRAFLERLRDVLEGRQPADRPTTLKPAEHRRSASYNISESEALVMQELENLRKQREKEEAVDFSNVMDEDNVRFSSDGGLQGKKRSSPIQIHQKGLGVDMQDSKASFSKNPDQLFDSDSDDAVVNGTDEKEDHLIAGLVSPTVAARHAELKKRRQVLNNPALEVSGSEFDTERSRRLRQEARRLMETAALEGTTTLLSSTLPCDAVPSTSSQANTSVRSLTSIEPKNELRCLEMVTPPVNIYNFKKILPSPNIQRKKYDAPIIPAFQLPSQRLSTSSSDIHGAAAFERVKRYGSMRSQELAETVAKIAGRAPVPTASTSSAEATPTRKLVSQWEKYNSNIGKIQEEQSRVASRLAEVSTKDDVISAKLKQTAASSDEEKNLLREHMQLLNEKDALVRKSEYLNVLEQLADVEHEIADLQRELGKASSLEEEKTEADKKSIDRMMEDLVKLINKKDQLSQKLIQQEAEDEEMNDRDRRTLEATAQFKRGYEQPVSASKRLITWFRSEITG